MPKLAFWSRLLSIIMKMGADYAKNRFQLGQMAEIVDHRGMPRGRRVSQRQAKDGADVIFKLARDCALDRPVPRVVNTRRKFVGDQLLALNEKLDSQHAGV